MFFTLTTILSTLTLLAAANLAPNPNPAPTSLSPSDELAKISGDVANYLTSATAQPEYTGAAAALTTLVPGSVQAQITGDPNGYLQSLMGADPSERPAWYTQLPQSYQNYWQSLGDGAVEIATSDAAAAPTGGSTNDAPGVKIAGGVIAAGAAALAFL